MEQKLKFEVYEYCLESTQFENKETKWKKILIQIVLEKIIKYNEL